MAGVWECAADTSRRADARPPSAHPPVPGRDGGDGSKTDGYRVIAFLREGRLFLQSRRGADLTPAFPDLARAAGAVGEDLVLDGELVTYAGSTSPACRSTPAAPAAEPSTSPAPSPPTS